jgi:hypothetical protein
VSRKTHRLFVFLAILAAVLEALVIGGVAVNRIPYSHVDALAAELELRTAGELVEVDRYGAWVFMGPGPHYEAVVRGDGAYDALSARLLDLGYSKDFADSGCASWTRGSGRTWGSVWICGESHASVSLDIRG